MGSKEDVAARIEADTKVKIEEMNQAISVHKDTVSNLFYSLNFTMIFSLRTMYLLFVIR